MLAVWGPLALSAPQAHAAGKQPSAVIQKRGAPPAKAPAATRSAPPSRPRKVSRASRELGTRIATRASGLVGVASLRKVDDSVPDDCTGVVRLAYESVGIELMTGMGRAGDNGVTHIYQRARSLGAVHKGRPQPGDFASSARRMIAIGTAAATMASPTWPSSSAWRRMAPSPSCTAAARAWRGGA